jgi:hypothetical protein
MQYGAFSALRLYGAQTADSQLAPRRLRPAPVQPDRPAAGLAAVAHLSAGSNHLPTGV